MPREIKRLQLDAAIKEISACALQHADRAPFFMIAGAGVSMPSVPLAGQIASDCEQRARSRLHTYENVPSRKAHLYSYWFERAFPQPKQRQLHLRSLIEGKPITQANLRLAHLLAKSHSIRLVVTPNFDDFLSRALNLFGVPHVICDHPATAARIDPESRDIQIVHAHGTYWFYDACNLEHEIVERASDSSGQYGSMKDLIREILKYKTPIVVGYSGWESDVLMYCLRERLQHGPLPYNLYWFCFSEADLADLPAWLTSHNSVRLIAPEAEFRLANYLHSDAGDVIGDEALSDLLRLQDGEQAVLPAHVVISRLIDGQGIEPPTLTTDPIGHFAGLLRGALPSSAEVHLEADAYGIGAVIRRLETAKALEQQGSSVATQVEAVHEAVRRADPATAIQLAENILRDTDALLRLPVVDIVSLFKAIWAATAEIYKDVDSAVAAFGIILGLLDILTRVTGTDSLELKVFRIQAQVERANRLLNTGRVEEARRLYSLALESEQPGLSEVATPHLVRAYVELGKLEQKTSAEAAITRFQRAIEVAGTGNQIAVERDVASAYSQLALVFFGMERWNECAHVVERMNEHLRSTDDDWVHRNLALALSLRATAYSRANEASMQLRAIEDLLDQYWSSNDDDIARWVVRAIVTKGYLLLKSADHEAADAVLQTAIDRFGEVDDDEFKIEVARALTLRGDVASALNDTERAQSYLRMVLGRFRSAGNDELRLRAALASGTLIGVAIGHGNLKEATQLMVRAVDDWGRDPSIQVRRSLLVDITLKASAMMNGLSYGDAVDVLELLDGIEYDHTIKNEFVFGWNLKATAYNEQQRYNEQIEMLDRVIAVLASEESSADGQELASVMIQRARALGDVDDSPAAINAFGEMLDRFRANSDDGIRQSVVTSLVIRGLLQSKARLIDEAIADYDEALEIASEGVGEAWDGLFCRTLLIGLSERIAVGEVDHVDATFAQFIQDGRWRRDDELRQTTAGFFTFLIGAVGELGRVQQAAGLLLQMEEQFGHDTDPNVIEHLRAARTLVGGNV